MKDIEVHLPDRPGALAAMSRALGLAGISIEGGGAWVIGRKGIGHFLFADDAPVVDVLAASGIDVVAEREAVLLRLDQARPGQLGEITGRMAAANINILVQYSDHDHQLVLVVDDPTAARAVAAAWMSRADERTATIGEISR